MSYFSRLIITSTQQWYAQISAQCMSMHYRTGCNHLTVHYGWKNYSWLTKMDKRINCLFGFCCKGSNLCELHCLQCTCFLRYLTAVQQVEEIWGSISRLPLLILYRFYTRSSDRSINDFDTPSVLLFLNDEPSAKLWIIFDMLIYTILKYIAVVIHYSNTLMILLRYHGNAC